MPLQPDARAPLRLSIPGPNYANQQPHQGTNIGWFPSYSICDAPGANVEARVVLGGASRNGALRSLRETRDLVEHYCFDLLLLLPSIPHGRRRRCGVLLRQHPRPLWPAWTTVAGRRDLQRLHRTHTVTGPRIARQCGGSNLSGISEP
jgi:hypothetical protein